MEVRALCAGSLARRARIVLAVPAALAFPAAACTFLARSPRESRMFAALAAAIGVAIDAWARTHSLHAMPAVMEPDRLAQAMLATADSARIAAADAAALGIAATAAAGALARTAARCDLPHRAAVAGAMAALAAVLGTAAGPVEARIQSSRDTLLRIRVEAYGRAVTMIDDRARHEPGYDRERAMALSALPLLASAFGVPAPVWAANPRAWEAHVEAGRGR
jgi:hypothetical protein